MIWVRSKGNFNNTEKLLKKSLGNEWLSVLEDYGRQGVQELAAATPLDSGQTALSWDYEIVREKGKVSVVWTNSNVNDGVNIAIILQYGHGTGWGGYVVGRDYINPALRPIFDSMADAAWKEVSGS
jgi:hypothetical protein